MYIATPVNARKEATLEEKRIAAMYRVMEIIRLALKEFPDADFHSAFDKDIAPIDKESPSEAVIMGKCVQRVIECDVVIMDEGWQESRGCFIEYRVAKAYDKEIFRVNQQGESKV